MYPVVMADHVHQDAVIDLYGPTLGQGAYVDGYLIEHLVDSGGHGAVYRARHARTGAAAAIKLLHAHLVGIPSLLARFQQEVLTLRAIEHPNIVRLFSAGTLDDGRPFYSMEWLAGQTLADELATRGRLSVRDALLTASHVADALAAAHAKGVIHRDVKARNVIVLAPDERQIKVIDFGVAKVSDTVTRTPVATTTTLLGSPATMAPEQLRGDPVCARTDVYGLGILLFHMLTGRLPFEASDASALEDKHLHAPPPSASALAPVPRGLDDVIARALAKDKAERYPGVAALIAEAWAAAEDERAQMPCIALYVHASESSGGAGSDVDVPVDENADDLDDALDAALAHAMVQITAAGMTIVWETAAGMLGIVTDTEPRSVAAVLDCALAICHPALVIAIHVDVVEIDGGQVTAGPVLHLGAWLPPLVPGRIRLTAAARSACNDQPGDQLDDPRVLSD
jgi:serine/threonine-protein kinase